MSPRRSGPGFSFLHAEGWSFREEAGVVSLWKSEQGGAVTLSAAENPDAADALEHCRRFAAKQAGDPPRIGGDRDVADAAFSAEDGVWWKVRVVVAGRRILLGTYNASVEDQVEEAEADGILASLAAL